MKLAFSPELNGSVSPPVTVLANPESVPETLSRSGTNTDLISIANAAQFEATQVIASVTLVPLDAVTAFFLCCADLETVPPPAT